MREVLTSGLLQLLYDQYRQHTVHPRYIAPTPLSSSFGQHLSRQSILKLDCTD